MSEGAQVSSLNALRDAAGHKAQIVERLERGIGGGDAADVVEQLFRATLDK